MVLGAPLTVGGMLLLASLLIMGSIAMHTVDPLVVIVVSFIGLFIYGIITTVVIAYIKTTFVMWAENQDLFAVNRPKYSQLLEQAATEAGARAHVFQRRYVCISSRKRKKNMRIGHEKHSCEKYVRNGTSIPHSQILIVDSKLWIAKTCVLLIDCA